MSNSDSSRRMSESMSGDSDLNVDNFMSWQI